MISVGVDVKRDDLKQALAYFDHIGGNSDKCLVRGINRTLPKVKTRSSQEIRKDVRLPAEYVKGKLATRKASVKVPRGSIRAEKRGLVLSRYDRDDSVWKNGLKKTGFLYAAPPVPEGGIQIQVKPTGGAKARTGLSSSWFYMLVKRGGKSTVLIARRLNETEKSSNRAKGGKSNYEVLYGPSVSQVWNNERQVIVPWATAEYERQSIKAVDDMLRLRFIKVT